MKALLLIFFETIKVPDSGKNIFRKKSIKAPSLCKYIDLAPHFSYNEKYSLRATLKENKYLKIYNSAK